MKRVSRMGKRIVSMLALVLFLTAGTLFAVSADVFPIVMYMEGNSANMGYTDLTTYFTQAFTKIAAMNFNAVRISNLPPTDFPTVLNIAQQKNLKLILDPGWGSNLMNLTTDNILANWNTYKTTITNEVNVYRNHTSFLGYALADEPQPEKIEQWKLVVKMFAEIDSVHKDYTVFNRHDMLASAASSTNPLVPMETVVFDNYPFEYSTADYTMTPTAHPNMGWYTYYKGFYDAYRNTAKYRKLQIPVLQAFHNYEVPWRMPLPQEYRTTVYTSLAAGARGVMAFLLVGFTTPTDTMVGVFDGNWNIVDTALYNEMKDLALKLHTLGPVVTGLKYVDHDSVSGWATTDTVLKGRFTNSAGDNFFIVANKNPNPAGATIQYSITLSGANYELLDMYSNEQYPANGSGVATVPLAPAFGRVLKERPKPAITVTAPAAGAYWRKGSPYAIQWTTASITGNVVIKLVNRAGGTPTTIATVAAGSSPYNYTVPPAQAEGTYYIQISQSPVTGNSGDFTIAAQVPLVSNPSPANNAVDVSLYPTLTWSADSQAVSFKVYFGTTTLAYKTTVTTKSYAVPTSPLMYYSTTYRWRIDAVNSAGTVTTGPIWSFTTKAAPPAISINMGNPDQNDHVYRVNFGDGETVPESIAGRDARRTIGDSDPYMYFNILDNWAYNGSKPRLAITIIYYDNNNAAGNGYLELQYNAPGNAYKCGGVVMLTGSNTWKQHTFYVEDAYCGNLQNGGADFRIARNLGGYMYLDIVHIATW